MSEALDRALVESLAAELRATSRAFTGGNVYHALMRARPELGPRWSQQRFERALERLVDRRPIAGLLPMRAAARTGRWPVAPREWDAYFPAAILVVDRPAIVDLFAASGVIVQSRIAVICVDGTPRHVVRWLQRAVRRGHRAPVGYLHDQDTVLYPFLFEPLATLIERSRRAPVAYRDLGIGPGRRLRDPLGYAGGRAAKARRLEEVPPSCLVAYAVQEVLRMAPGDPMLAPIRPQESSS